MPEDDEREEEERKDGPPEPTEEDDRLANLAREDHDESFEESLQSVLGEGLPDVEAPPAMDSPPPPKPLRLPGDEPQKIEGEGLILPPEPTIEIPDFDVPEISIGGIEDVQLPEPVPPARRHGEPIRFPSDQMEPLEDPLAVAPDIRPAERPEVSGETPAEEITKLLEKIAEAQDKSVEHLQALVEAMGELKGILAQVGLDVQGIRNDPPAAKWGP